MSPIDGHNITNGTYSSTSSPTITTAFAADVIFVYGADSSGPTWGADAGYTARATNSWHVVDDKVVSVTGNYNGKPTGPGASDNWTVGIVGIKGQ